jgi:hypothetical protein
MLDSVFSTAPHELHHRRYAPLDQFFRTRIVNQFAPLIEEKVRKATWTIRGNSRHQDVLYLDTAFMALTTDIISDYAFAHE